MRVLLYNWVDDRDPERRGGGVRLYQANLRDALARQAGVEVVSLSSGLAHSVRRGAPRWRRVRGARAEARFEIVDSALLAPAHAHFASPAQIDDASTLAAFADFVAQHGPFDVIHFNGLEGIPATALAAAAASGARVIVSLHNYYPFCAQVNLWAEEAQSCTDFDGGKRCLSCLPVRASPRTVRLAYAVEAAFHRVGLGPGTMAFDRAFRPLMALGWRMVKRAAALRRRGAVPPVASGRSAALPAAHPSPQPSPQASPQSSPPRAPETARWHAARRARFVALLNAHADAVLCVSDRVRQIAVAHGVDAARARTSLIGTPEAAHWTRTRPRTALLDGDGVLTLAYLGYMRRDKGYYFLLDALETLPRDLAARVRLKVAACPRESGDLARLRALQGRLAGVVHHNGYRHAELDALLEDVTLGVIPALWEDNLPQVAIEMHARHVPLMTSDRGGARELGNCPELVFAAGDAAAFHGVIAAVLAGRVHAGAYWRNAIAPVDMTAHLAELDRIYRGAT